MHRAFPTFPRRTALLTEAFLKLWARFYLSPPAITLGNGKIKKDKGFVIDISVNEYTAELPDEFGLKLLSGGEMKKLFKNEMQFHFTPYDVKIAGSGINAVVKRCLTTERNSLPFAKSAASP